MRAVGFCVCAVLACIAVGAAFEAAELAAKIGWIAVFIFVAIAAAGFLMIWQPTPVWRAR